MKRVWVHVGKLNAITREQFKNYTKWFRALSYISGPVTTIAILSFLMPFPFNDMFFVLMIIYYILFVGTFFVESIIHGIRYCYNQRGHK